MSVGFWNSIERCPVLLAYLFGILPGGLLGRSSLLNEHERCCTDEGENETTKKAIHDDSEYIALLILRLVANESTSRVRTIWVYSERNSVRRVVKSCDEVQEESRPEEHEVRFTYQCALHSNSTLVPS